MKEVLFIPQGMCLKMYKVRYETFCKCLYVLNSENSTPDESLLSILRAANKTGRFWVGASDFEERGKFKWYYSGKPVSESNWFENGGRPKPTATKDDDESCLQVIFIFSSHKFFYAQSLKYVETRSKH